MHRITTAAVCNNPLTAAVEKELMNEGLARLFREVVLNPLLFVIPADGGTQGIRSLSFSASSTLKVPEFTPPPPPKRLMRVAKPMD